MIPTQRSHGWDILIGHRASPGLAGEILQGGPDYYLLFSLFPLAIIQAVFHAIDVSDIIVIAIAVLLLPSPTLQPPPLQN